MKIIKWNGGACLASPGQAPWPSTRDLMDRRSDSTFSLSTLVSTWAVPPKLSHQDSTSHRLLQSTHICSTLGLSAVDNKTRSGSNGAPGRERKNSQEKALMKQVPPLGLGRSAAATTTPGARASGYGVVEQCCWFLYHISCCGF